MQQIAHRQSVPLTQGLQGRLAEEFQWVAQAKVRHWYGAVRDSEDLPWLGNPEHADPTHTDAIGTSNQPRICATQQVEYDYHVRADLPSINMDGITGAWVERDGDRRQLEPMSGSPGSAFSAGCVLAVRREADERARCQHASSCLAFIPTMRRIRALAGFTESSLGMRTRRFYLALVAPTAWACRRTSLRRPAVMIR